MLYHLKTTIWLELIYLLKYYCEDEHPSKHFYTQCWYEHVKYAQKYESLVTKVIGETIIVQHPKSTYYYHTLYLDNLYGYFRCAYTYIHNENQHTLTQMHMHLN